MSPVSELGTLSWGPYEGNQKASSREGWVQREKGNKTGTQNELACKMSNLMWKAEVWRIPHQSEMISLQGGGDYKGFWKQFPKKYV